MIFAVKVFFPPILYGWYLALATFFLYFAQQWRVVADIFFSQQKGGSRIDLSASLGFDPPIICEVCGDCRFFR
jgi:hypothetical protein